MKLLILTFSILLLASCSQDKQIYFHNITYAKCNGTTTGVIKGTGSYIPSFRDNEITFNKIILTDVCDFSYTSNPL